VYIYIYHIVPLSLYIYNIICVFCTSHVRTYVVIVSIQAGLTVYTLGSDYDLLDPAKVQNK
jgi:hypothetical protein